MQPCWHPPCSLRPSACSTAAGAHKDLPLLLPMPRTCSCRGLVPAVPIEAAAAAGVPAAALEAPFVECAHRFLTHDRQEWCLLLADDGGALPLPPAAASVVAWVPAPSACLLWNGSVECWLSTNRRPRTPRIASGGQ